MDDTDELRRIARNYFWFFWTEGLAKAFKKSDLLPFPYAVNKTNGKQFFQDYFAMVFRILNDPAVVDCISSMFALELSEGGNLRQFSIRNIRSIASLVRFGLLDFLLYNKRHDCALARIREHVTANGMLAVAVPANATSAFRIGSGGALWFRELTWFEGLRLVILGTEDIAIVNHAKTRVTEKIRGEDCEELRSEIRRIVGLSIRKVFL